MVRFARVPLAAALLFGTFGLSAPLAAQEAALPRTTAIPDATVPGRPGATVLPPESPKPRPAALMPLYVSFGALQLIDVHSTSRALDRGAVEANPLMKGLASHQVGLTVVKAAGAAATIYATERMWKTNRKAAIVFAIATNAAMAWVVQHNYRAVR
jgi:uncharacterized protein DUF5658